LPPAAPGSASARNRLLDTARYRPNGRRVGSRGQIVSTPGVCSKPFAGVVADVIGFNNLMPIHVPSGNCASLPNFVARTTSWPARTEDQPLRRGTSLVKGGVAVHCRRVVERALWTPSSRMRAVDGRDQFGFSSPAPVEIERDHWPSIPRAERRTTRGALARPRVRARIQMILPFLGVVRRGRAIPVRSHRLPRRVQARCEAWGAPPAQARERFERPAAIAVKAGSDFVKSHRHPVNIGLNPFVRLAATAGLPGRCSLWPTEAARSRNVLATKTGLHGWAQGRR